MSLAGFPGSGPGRPHSTTGRMHEGWPSTLFPLLYRIADDRLLHLRLRRGQVFFLVHPGDLVAAGRDELVEPLDGWPFLAVRPEVQNLGDRAAVIPRFDLHWDFR